MTNDIVVDTKNINVGHTITLEGSNVTHIPNETTNVVQNNQERGKPRKTRKYPPRWQYTPLGEPIEYVLKKILQLKVIQLPPLQHNDPGKFKPSWWDDNATCEYRCAKEYTTLACCELKNIM